MTSTMSSWGVRKPVRTYSRQKKHSLHNEEPPTKRRRVEAVIESAEKICITIPASNSSPAGNVSPVPPSSPRETQAIFSDEPLRSTPPSSPIPESSSPPINARRLMFSSLKRNPEATINEPLVERSHNVEYPPKPPPPPPPPKKKRLVQMQLDIVGELRKTCKVCGMDYIPSNAEDATLHRKFHAMNVGGVDFTKAFVERLRQNQIWAGRNGSFIAAVGRRDKLAFRNKAVEVLQVVNTELAAVSIPEEELWSQIRVSISKNAPMPGEKAQTSAIRQETCSNSDRFKAYLYIQGQKCVGACLAERIQEAYTVVDQADASERTGQVPTEVHSSSVSVDTVAKPVILGISRVWTSNLHRKHGIATRLLDCVRSDFLYGMTIEKGMIAFSQPTESGGKLAKKWFGRQAGWHVYVD